jgi:HEAT repeat protein
MNPLARLAAFLDLRPGEGLTFGLLVGHSFALGGALVFGEVSASALFLTTFGADDLAYVYLAAPAFIALIGVGHVWLARWVSAGRLLTAILMMLCGSAGLFVVGLRLLGGGWLVFALMLWYWALEYLASLEFWALAGRLLNLQQGKRLFGPIGAGQLAAQMAGFWLTPLLVSFVGAENLLLLSTACVGVALVALTVTVRRFPVLAAGPDAEPGEEHTPSGGAGALTEQLKDRYVLAICLGTVLSTGAYLFIEYGFAAQSEARYQDADELARFFGVVFGAMSAAQLPARLFLSRWVLGRFGLGAGLLALPLVTGAGMASVAVAGTFALPIGLIFGLMIATRLGEGVVRDALYRTAELLLYQPLRTEQRLAVQTAVESVVDPLAMGLAGAALLLLGRTDGFTVARLALVSLPIIALWIAVSLASYRGYIVALNRALAKRLLGGQDLALDDAATLGVIEAKLVSPHPGEALYALDLLAQAAPDRLAPRLAVLLAHPEPLVRREVTRRIERLRLVGAVPTLRARLADEGDPTTLATLVSALGALASDDRAVAAPLVPYLRHPDARVRLGAIVALLNGRRSTGAQAAGRLLAHLYESPDPRERVLAAVGLGRLDADRAAGPLGRLLADAEPTVRRAALAAAGQVRAPELWPLAVEGLRAPATRRAAAAALVSGGEGALPAIIAAAASAAVANGHEELGAGEGPVDVLAR